MDGLYPEMNKTLLVSGILAITARESAILEAWR
jgi:hypothetical protein